MTDASGDVAVTAVSILGPEVTLTLGRALAADARVSYGWSVEPVSAWLVDDAGIPTPCFHDVAAVP